MADVNKLIYGDNAADVRFGLSALLTEAELASINAECREAMTKPEGPYIVWEDGGCEGWSPKSYPTLKEALEGHRYATEWVVTKRVSYEVTETEDAPQDHNPGT